jgi:hypothetical protein
MVNETSDMDGTTQNISGLACKRPDCNWQIEEQVTGVALRGDRLRTITPQAFDDSAFDSKIPPTNSK